MWMTFFCGALLTLFLLYAPGFVQLFAAKCKATYAIILAPVVSIFELCVIGIGLGVLGVSVTGSILIGSTVGLSVVVSCLAFLINRRDSTKYRDLISGSDVSWKNVFFYVLFAILVTGYFFVRTLDGPESFVQEFDNAFHLNLIQAFMESGRYSVLQATTFPTLPLLPWSDFSYYPAAWHVLAAVCGNVLGVSAQMSENFVNTIMLAFVFPVSMCAFASVVFKKNSKIVLYCGLFVLAFAAFPWGFLVAGPLYSNFAAFAILPAVMYCFIDMLSCTSIKQLLPRFALLLIAIAVLVMMQPNAVFTAIVILAPYCMLKIFLRYKSLNKAAKGMLLAIAFLAVVVLIWIALRHMGMFQGVVNYSWAPYASITQATFDFLDLGYRNATAQVLLAFLVLVGILYLLYKKQYRWLIAGYLFFFVAFLSAGATSTGFYGSFFSGFWYNDVDRLAACAVLTMILFAGIGFHALVSIVLLCIKKAWGSDGSQRVAKACLSVLCAGLIFAPNHILAGMGDVQTSMGSRGARLAELATTAVCLTKEEEDFASEVVSLIGEDVKVANFAFDGSVFTYSTSGLNTLSKHYFSASSGDLNVVQEHLDEISSNKEVQEAVNNLEVKYVLLLDAGENGDNSVYQSFLNKDDWKGITSINDETPGFKVVLAKGDMRLYEIEPVG